MGEQIFQKLIDFEKIKIVGIVTNFGIDNWWGTNSIYEWAINRLDGSKVLSSESKLQNAEINCLLDLDFDLIMSIQYGWKIPTSLMQKSSFAINLHMSPLPKFRGHHPFFHAIFEDEKMFGVTLHLLSDIFDNGDFISQKLFRISKNETAYSLYKKSIDESNKLFDSFIYDLLNNKIVKTRPQEEIGKFYSKDLLRNITGNLEKLTLAERGRLKRALFFPPIFGSRHQQETT